MKMKWDNVFQDVPSVFHERIMETLEMKHNIKNKKVIKARRFIIIVAAILALGTLTAGAYTVINRLWNPKLAEIFEAYETIQEQLINDGMVFTPANLSTTDNGVTAEVVQTLGDKSFNYILLRFTSENALLFEGEPFSLNVEVPDFNIGNVDENGEPTYGVSGGGGFIDEYDEILTGENGQNIYQRYYSVYVNNNHEYDLNKKTITISFKDFIQFENFKLSDNYTTLIEGEWRISWELTFQDQTQIFELNKEIDINGYSLMVETVEISPLSMKVVLGGRDLERVAELDNGFNAYPILKDGTVLKNNSAGSGGWINIEHETLFNECGFNKILDVEQVKGIQLYFPNRGFIEDRVEFSLFM